MNEPGCLHVFGDQHLDEPIRFCPWCGARVQLYPIPKGKP